MRKVRLINTSVRTCVRGIAGVAGAVAAASLALSGAAQAQPGPAAPPPDPRLACEAPSFGGVFVTVSPTQSQCQYIVAGNFYYDNYDGAMYTGTLVYRDGAKVPTERPTMPETLTMPGGVPLIMPFPGAS